MENLILVLLLSLLSIGLGFAAGRLINILGAPEAPEAPETPETTTPTPAPAPAPTAGPSFFDDWSFDDDQPIEELPPIVGPRPIDRSIMEVEVTDQNRSVTIRIREGGRLVGRLSARPDDKTPHAMYITWCGNHSHESGEPLSGVATVLYEHVAEFAKSRGFTHLSGSIISPRVAFARRKVCKGYDPQELAERIRAAGQLYTVLELA